MWCRYCNGNTRQQGEENFKLRVAERKGTILGNYTGNNNKVLVQCELGHQWEIFPFNLTSGKWCPVCGYKHHKGGSDKFYQVVAENKGEVLGQYVNARTRIQIKCAKGHTWDPKAYYIVIGNWCPFCTGSSGENIISLYLTEKNIPYTSQGTIKDLPRKRFDFIINYKGQTIIVEYDGQMHFRYMEYYHITEEYFRYRQSVDRVKTLVAVTNNCRVIRIDYSQLANIRHHLDIALDSDDMLYLSTPKLYEGWLSGAIVSQEELKAVYEGKSRPDYNACVADDTIVCRNNNVNNITHGLSLVIIR